MQDEALKDVSNLVVGERFEDFDTIWRPSRRFIPIRKTFRLILLHEQATVDNPNAVLVDTFTVSGCAVKHDAHLSAVYF
jgi:hypothetical protein